MKTMEARASGVGSKIIIALLWVFVLRLATNGSHEINTNVTPHY